MTQPTSSKQKKPGGQIQNAVTVGSNVAYTVYKSFFSGVISQVVPTHTRDAAFQLFCDLRANTPKDKKFLQRHGQALTPRTNLGWLALAAALAYTLSGLLMLSTAALGISVMGVTAGLFAILTAGMFLTSALGFLAFVLMTAALVTGTVAFAALSTYGGATASLSVMKYITTMVFGPPPAKEQQHSKPLELQMHSLPTRSGTSFAVTRSPTPAVQRADKSPTKPGSDALPAAPESGNGSSPERVHTRLSTVEEEKDPETVEEAIEEFLEAAGQQHQPSDPAAIAIAIEQAAAGTETPAEPSPSLNQEAEAEEMQEERLTNEESKEAAPLLKEAERVESKSTKKLATADDPSGSAPATPSPSHSTPALESSDKATIPIIIS